jgi:ribonuclease E
MLENEPTGGPDRGDSPAADVPPTRARKRATKKAPADGAPPPQEDKTQQQEDTTAPVKKAAKRARKAADPAAKSAKAAKSAAPAGPPAAASAEPAAKTARKAAKRVAPVPPAIAFIAPEPVTLPAPRPSGPPPADEPVAATGSTPGDLGSQGPQAEQQVAAADGDRPGRRRGRRGRGRGRGKDDDGTDESAETPVVEAVAGAADPGADGARAESDEPAEDGDGDSASSRRRRRRRRRTAGEAEPDKAPADDPPNTVVKVRKTRPPRGRDTDDEVQGVKGSVRLEAKRQRRRDGRDQGRKRPAIITEAEFLARREAVDRVMVVRQVKDRTQVAVLEDGVLVEHYVTKASSTAYAGNVYLGKVQNVLPSMEAAFVDIGKGRNAVLYAGEVNWDAAGMEGKARRIEDALKAGQSVLTQVTKDPVGHKGARLTSQISLPGRFLVYVPEGSMTGISRKLPDTERKRLKDILKDIVPDEAGVIIRTASEGASEEELTRDVKRLQAQWKAIEEKAAKASAPALLYGEPDLVIRVVRDIFNEDFQSLVVSGDEAWELVEEYVKHVSPDLVDRLSRHTADSDVFADLRIDEQLAKALDRKVWLPSGGSLVIDRTEAMTVVDVNTGKFTGKGGNLEETVTRNNLEAAEEIVRQLRLRDIGGMIVIDFIDMILEANRDLVLRRLTECLSRDRTRHQVAEVTSLGLVQMTRKRVGQGLLEVFSEPCETCKGRGLIVHMEPVEHSTAAEQRHEVSEPKPRASRRAAGAGGGGSEPVAVERAAEQPVVVSSPRGGALAEPVVDAPDGGGLAEPVVAEQAAAAPARRRPRRAASRPAGPPVDDTAAEQLAAR